MGSRCRDLGCSGCLVAPGARGFGALRASQGLGGQSEGRGLQVFSGFQRLQVFQRLQGLWGAHGLPGPRGSV
eukprot:8630693-Pyramimonas_sp.AAC.1